MAENRAQAGDTWDRLTPLMRQAPRVLALSQSLPFPPHSGVTNRTFHIFTELQREFNLELVPFFRINHQPRPRDRQDSRRELAARLTAVAEPVAIPGEHSKSRKIFDHLRSRLTGHPYTWYEYHSEQYLRTVRESLRRNTPDLVHLDSLDLYRYITVIGAIPVICTHHSVESDLLRLRAERLESSLVRRYVDWQANRLEEIERRVTPALGLNVMMSEVDARRLRALAPGAATAVVPNGVDTEFFQPGSDTGLAGRVVFVGPTYSFPNLDAVDFLADEIWPLVRRSLPEATLQVVGRTAPEHRPRFARVEGMALAGHLEDLRPSLAAASCVVAPLRIGGGTRLKILDAWAMGKAVVSTSLGCEGLDARDGINILVRDDAARFAEAVRTVLTDDGLRARLGASGRETVLSRYSWTSIGATVREKYREVLRTARPA